MKPLVRVIPIVCLLTSFGMVALSQPLPPHGEEGAAPHRRGGATLFLVRATGAQVVPPGKSLATATSAFVVDPAKKDMEYDVTYHGLERGAAKQIALYNFGKGGNGTLIHTLCGTKTTPCPNQPWGNIRGRWDGHGPMELDATLLSEMASARVYLEIIGGEGRPEIRGQLEPNGAMLPVKNYVAHLAPTTGAGARGVGTAVMSEVYYADGRIAVVYEVTVAGTSGTPRKAALVNLPASVDESKDEPKRPPTLRPEHELPKMRLSPSRQPKTGGTLSGEYDIPRGQRDGVTASRLLSESNTEVGISVATSTFPQGELYGVFTRVR